MPYIGTQPKDVRSFGKIQFDFTATQGQTAFTGADDDGKTLGFTEGQIQVYVNGILMDASDYTASGSNTITLVSAANLNDIITVVALQTDIPNSDYVPISGGTFTGNISGTTADFSGNVGVGTSSPQATLHVSDIGSTGPALLIAGGSGTEGDVVVPHNEQLQVGHWNNTTSTFTERMKIDTAGRVTMPHQPAFHVRELSFNNNGTASNGTGGTVHTNRGSHYNSTNGRFTAPVAGVYWFWGSVQHFQSGTTTYIGLRFRKNGVDDTTEYVSGYGGGFNNHQTQEGAYVTNLNVGDYVNIYANRGARDATQNAFMGYLIG